MKPPIDGMYKFNEPIDHVFLKVMDRRSKSEGNPLGRDEQRFLAVCLHEWAKQNVPAGEDRDKIITTIKNRWPDINWGNPFDGN